MPWVDPHLDAPHGGLVPWPPLWDHAIATAAVLTGSGADAEHVARVAALLPLAVAAATAALLVTLGRALGAGNGVAAAFIASALPASVGYGFVGLADQHALELLLWCAALLAYVVAAREEGGPRGAPVLLGVLLALSFWNWLGSAVYLVLLAAHAGVNHVVEPAGPGPARRAEVALMSGAAVAALLLGTSIAVLAPEGALLRMTIGSIGGLSVLLCAGVAIGAGVLLLGRAARRAAPGGLSRRVGEVVVAGCVAGAAVLLAPGAMEGVRRGLTAAGAANAWYRSIGEFRPMVGSGIVPVTHELAQVVAFFGLTFLVLPFALAAGRRAWAESPQRRAELLLLGVWCIASVAAAVGRMRFMLYASAPLGVCCAAWLELRARRSPRWGRAIVAAGALAIVVPAYALFSKPGPASDPALVAAAGWIASSAPPGTEPPIVMTSWSDGHALRAAGLAVVASPFGTEISVQSLRDEATFFGSVSGEDALAIARRRGIGFIIVREPIDTVFSVQDYRDDPGSGPPVDEERSWLSGASYDPRPHFPRTVVARLFYGDGMASRRHPEPALGWARLVREELPPAQSGAPDARQVKTFGVVPGALLRVRGASPGARVTATARVATNAGRTFAWTTWGIADGRGAATLRVPYTSGANGACRAEAYSVGDGARSATVAVGDEQVTAGAEVAIDLAATAGVGGR